MVSRMPVCTKAEYLPQAIEEYKGNPLIEALPPILSPEKAADFLTVEPGYHAAERELDALYRTASNGCPATSSHWIPTLTSSSEYQGASARDMWTGTRSPHFQGTTSAASVQRLPALQ